MLFANELRTKQITKVLGFPQGNTFIFFFRIGLKTATKIFTIKIN